MSRIFKKEATPSFIRDFAMPDLGASSTAGGGEEAAFVRDFERTEGGVEFVPGGFDFDYKGGLRRDEILRRSMDEAEKILNEARNSADAIRNKARDDGYQAGYASGYESGIAEARPVMEAFTGLVNELAIARSQFYENSEEEMIHLVINVARKVIAEDVAMNPSLVRKVLLKAVQKLAAREEMIIRVNPKDLAEAEKSVPDLRREVEDIEKVSFKGDMMISRGGCMVETNIGSIDARVETQLESIRESFMETLEESKKEQEMGGAPDAQG